MNNNNPNPDEQNLDVFRYVAEEMSPGEEQHFEQLLQQDQTLREQVASMVSTMAMVDKAYATSKVSPAIAKRTAKLRTRRLIVSVAALIAIATLAVSLVQSPARSDSDAESIAMAWAESVGSDEFELPELEDNIEFASFELESEDDWIVDVVVAVNEDPASLN